MFRKSKIGDNKLDSSLNMNLLDLESQRNLIPETLQNSTDTVPISGFNVFHRDPNKSVVESLRGFRQVFNENEDIDKLPLSDDAINGMKKIPLNTVGILKDYELNNYLDDQLAPQSRFCRRLSRDQVMKWQNSEISAPLIKILNETLHETGTSMFNHLLMYTNDKRPINDKYYHARKFVRLPLNQQDGDELKEEAYIQCLKQLKGNPDPEKLDLAWSALCILASSYLPSARSLRLYYSILNFLFVYSKLNDSNPKVGQRCEYAYSRLYNTSLATRTEIPSRTEMLYIEKMKPITIPVYLFSGDYIYVHFESYSTIKQVKDQLMEKLGLNPTRFNYYGLFEVCEKEDCSEERFLDDSKLLSDVLSIWEQIQNLEENQNKKVEFKIYLKIKYFYQVGEEDIDTVTLQYYQILYQFLKGRLKMEEKHVISLAALKLLSEFSIRREEAYENLDRFLENYIPFNLLSTNPPQFWIQKVMEFYTNLSDYSPLEAQRNFIDIALKDQLANAHQIIVQIPDEKLDHSPNEVIDLTQFSEKIILAFKPEDLLILNYDRDYSNAISIKYSHLENWAVNTSNLFFNQKINDQGDLKKFYFKTDQGLEIQEILDVYTSIKAGKDEKEFLKLKSEYPEKFRKVYDNFSRRAYSTFANKSE